MVTPVKRQKKPTKASLKAPPKPRARRGTGSLGEKTAYRTDPATGKRVDYIYWQAARDVPEHLRAAHRNRPRVTGSGRTRTEALERLEANWEKMLKGEKDRRRTKRSPSSKTLGDLYEEWNTNNVRGKVSETVAKKYEGYFRNHILEHFRDRRLSQLTEDDFTLYFYEILSNKRHAPKPGQKRGDLMLGGTARRNIFMALSGCLGYGVRKNYLPYSPLAAVTPPRRTTSKVEVEQFSEYATTLLSALAADGDPDYCRWLCQFLGLRRAERLGLRWSCFSDSGKGQGLLTVDSQLARHEDGSGWYIKPDTKNHHRRTISVPEPFLSAIRTYRETQNEWKSLPEWKSQKEFADLVFLRPNGALITLNRDNEEWHAVLVAHDLPYWRGHINRHITATWLAEEDPPLDIGVVQSILGHESEAMTHYYAHLTHKRQLDPMRRYGATIAKRLATD
jgi:integrase